MVALRLHGLEVGTEPERSGSGAGAERERSGFDDFNVFFTVFHGFLACRFAPASLPLHSRFLFLVFLNVFCILIQFFLIFWIFEHFFDFLDVFMFFSLEFLVCLERIASFMSSPVRSSPGFFHEFDHSVFLHFLTH